MDSSAVTVFAMQILPVVYVGLALVVIGIALIAAEFHLPTLGLLGMLGVLSIFAGYVTLLHANAPGLEVGLPIVAAIGVVGALLVVVAVAVALRGRHQPVATGEPGMLGAKVDVTADFVGGKGRVRYGGELWNAHSEAPLRAGQSARVVAVEGLELRVEPV